MSRTRSAQQRRTLHMPALVGLRRSSVKGAMDCLGEQVRRVEAGGMSRFACAGNFASDARTVDRRRASNGKKRGNGNAKYGSKHLACTFIEAAPASARKLALNAHVANGSPQPAEASQPLIDPR